MNIPGDADTINEKYEDDGFGGFDTLYQSSITYEHLYTYHSNYVYDGAVDLKKRMKIYMYNPSDYAVGVKFQVYTLEDVLIYQTDWITVASKHSATYYYNIEQKDYKINFDGYYMQTQVWTRRAQNTIETGMKLKKWNADYTAFELSTLDSPILLVQEDYTNNLIGGEF